jgi:hypothetical protein
MLGNDTSMNNLLKQIFLNHTEKMSDKWTLYINEWDRIFTPYRDLPINLFEIGIQNGGSLEIWAKYFTNAKSIIGCDIDEKCRELLFTDPRIAFYVGDANTNEIQEKVLESAPKFDIIIDDGSHRSSDVIRSFCRYYPYLEYDGIYVVEDLHTSYWEDFEGSIFSPESSMSFLKHIADIVNHEHWRNNQARVNFLSEFSDYLQISFTEEDLLSIHSIEFVNSLCIVKKRRPDENVLGRRIVVGSEELVTIGLAKLDGTHIQDFSMAIKDDSDLNVSNLVKNLEATNHSVEILTVDLGKKEQLISDLGKGLEDEKRVTEMLSANLTERDQELVKLTTDLAMRDQTQETLTTSLAERDQTLENLQIALTESQKEVVEYTQSNSWRITRPLRKISKYLQGNNDEPDTTAL